MISIYTAGCDPVIFLGISRACVPDKNLCMRNAPVPWQNWQFTKDREKNCRVHPVVRQRTTPYTYYYNHIVDDEDRVVSPRPWCERSDRFRIPVVAIYTKFGRSNIVLYRGLYRIWSCGLYCIIYYIGIYYI